METNKFTGIVVGVVVSVLLICSLMIPVISNATQGTETTTEVEGAYWPLTYQSQPENGTYYYFRSSYNSGTGIISIQNSFNPYVTLKEYTVDDVTNQIIIVYADTNVTVYIDNGNYNFAFVDDSYNATPVPITTQGFIMVNGQNVGKFNFGSGNTFDLPKPTYYYVIDDDGDYANFIGDNPPPMDTPAVTVDGAYIGEKYITTSDKPSYSAILNMIPILMILGLIVTVTGLFVYRRL